MTEPASPTASVPPVDRAAWRALVERDLKGRPYEEALVTRLLEGIELAPLYTEADGDASDARSGVPGLGSWTRGARPLGNTEGGWTVAVDAPPGAPQEVSAALQDDLAHGVSGINLALPEDEPSSRALLDGLLGGAPEAASLHLAPSADPAARGERLFAAWERTGTPAAARRGNLGGDPFALLCDGVELPPSEVVWERLAAACRLAGERPGVRALELRADRYHEAGAHAAQELGLGIAAGIAALRGLDAAGLSPLHAARQLGFAFALDPDVFLGIAKLRAARRLWARVLSVLDAQGAGPAPLHARVGARCLTAYHPQGNLLRSTLATFAGAVGGAERITVLPHDAALAQPEAASRRLARNTQLVLLHEAHLHRVIDPAGGSYYVEVLTDRLSERSWEVVRAVEGQGGLRRALERGWVAERLAETRQRSSERVAHRVQAIVGVSVFPDPGEGPRALRADSQFPPDAGGPSARLPRLRLAADFEELRQRSDARLAASGKRPCVFLASMGPLAAHTARSTWAANLLAAGGFEAVSGDGFPDAAAAAAAFAAIGLRAAVVCASDAFLDEALPAVVKALREAGAKRVVVAAPPRPSLADAGADAFVHRGSDALAFLRSLWEEEAER